MNHFQNVQITFHYVQEKFHVTASYKQTAVCEFWQEQAYVKMF